jgi:hypothetical protein
MLVVGREHVTICSLSAANLPIKGLAMCASYTLSGGTDESIRPFGVSRSRNATNRRNCFKIIDLAVQQNPR